MRIAALAIGAFAIAAAQAPAPAPAPTTLDRVALAARVRAEFVHAWDGYKRLAWGHDELSPLSGKPYDWHATPLYMTALDALDTMWLMGMRKEAERTKTYLLQHLSFDRDITVKNFEITIRILGGLLSAHQLMGDARLLALADDLGTRLMPAFDSPTGMPYMYVNLKTGQASGAESNPAEIGTLILEFETLSRLTRKPVFGQRAKKALVQLYQRRARTGLVGDGINVETGESTSRTSHVGGGIDSYYEYLLKCERLFGDEECGTMYRTSEMAVNRYLADDVPDVGLKVFSAARPLGALWYGESDMRSGERTATRYGALHAFFPAVLAMGGDVGRARRLQDSGLRMWTLHGLEPESLDYKAMKVVDPGYQLRPEIIESAYYLFHYTKDPGYLEMGRIFLDDLVRFCRVANGYTVVDDVVSKKQGDRMHSFFLAETLKYLYLLFEPGAIEFDGVVFNTEAHPLRKVARPVERRGAGL